MKKLKEDFERVQKEKVQLRSLRWSTYGEQVELEDRQHAMEKQLQQVLQDRQALAEKEEERAEKLARARAEREEAEQIEAEVRGRRSESVC